MCTLIEVAGSVESEMQIAVAVAVAKGFREVCKIGEEMV